MRRRRRPESGHRTWATSRTSHTEKKTKVKKKKKTEREKQKKSSEKKIDKNRKNAHTRRNAPHYARGLIGRCVDTGRFNRKGLVGKLLEKQTVSRLQKKKKKHTRIRHFFFFFVLSFTEINKNTRQTRPRGRRR